jgi:hypothetical protein
LTGRSSHSRSRSTRCARPSGRGRCSLSRPRSNHEGARERLTHDGRSLREQAVQVDGGWFLFLLTADGDPAGLPASTTIRTPTAAEAEHCTFRRGSLLRVRS